MLFEERKILPRKYDCLIHCDLETRVWIRFYARKYGITMPEALFEIVNYFIAHEENIVDDPSLGK